jgi:glycosyltransferase involved in cell wall biosynthesis
MAPAHRTVIFVAPAPTAHGGIASAVSSLAGRHAGPYQIELLPTFYGGGAARKVGAALRSFTRASWRFGGRDVAVVHIHASKGWSFRRKLLFHALARLWRRPVVWQLHYDFASYYRECSRLERALMRAAFRSSSSVASVYRAGNEALAAATGLENGRVLANVVEIGPLPSSDEPLVLFLGRLHPSKGLSLFLRALAGVVERVPDVRAVIAGSGDAAPIRAEARARGIADRVELVGWVEGEEKVKLLRRAAVLVNPSFIEALPMAVLEGMAAGRAVVATRVGGVPEVVEDGKTGLLVEPGDEEGLREALIRLLDNEALRRELGAAAARSVDGWQLENVLEQLGGLYAEASLNRAP